MSPFRAVPAILSGIALMVASAVASAEPMTPLPSEYLDQPIHLTCGLVIREWHGASRPSSAAVAKMDRLCADATLRFRPFLEKHGLGPRATGPFDWSEALIPDGYCHRCLNDTRWRFERRFVHGDVWGYTGIFEQYSFVVSDTLLPIFPLVFVHELFHAMSMFYGVFEAHPGSDWDKVEADEQLARAFTVSMGLGE